jgi:dTDP-glucose 4,6-dehydratase
MDVIRRVLKLMGKPEKLISFVTDRPGHDKRYAVDARKIKKELGWQPEVVWEDGLRELIAWYTAGSAP